MAKQRRKRTPATDPLLRPCSACGAIPGEGCKTVGNNDKPLVSRATRLVHADRLEGATANA